MAEASKSGVFVPIVVLFYMAMSVGTTLMNKGAFPKDKFPFPFFITCFQMGVALLWLGALSVFQRVAPEGAVQFFGLNKQELLRWRISDIFSAAGAAGAFTGMLSSGNLCLMFVQVSFYQVAKSQHILCILLLQYFWLKQKHPSNIILACFGVTVGFIINCMAEADITLSVLGENLGSLVNGCIAGFISSFFVALYPIMLQRSMLKGQNNWQISINVNAMSMVWYLPLIAYEAYFGDLLSSPAWSDRDFWVYNFATATVGFVLNVAAMLQVKFTSPLTHMIVGSAKGAVQSVLGVFLFNNKMRLQSAVGLSVLLMSSFGYSYFKHTTAKQKDDKKIAKQE